MGRRRNRWLEWLLLGVSLPLLLVPYGAVVVTGVTALVLNLRKRVSPNRQSAILTASIPILGLTPVAAATILTLATVFLHQPVVDGFEEISKHELEVKAIPGITRIHLIASFSDLDPADSLEAVVSWGDDTSSELGPVTSPIELCHTYDVPGVYDVQIVVTDSIGLEDSRVIVAGVPAAYHGPEPC